MWFHYHLLFIVWIIFLLLLNVPHCCLWKNFFPSSSNKLHSFHLGNCLYWNHSHKCRYQAWFDMKVVYTYKSFNYLITHNNIIGRNMQTTTTWKTQATSLLNEIPGKNITSTHYGKTKLSSPCVCHNPSMEYFILFMLLVLVGLTVGSWDLLLYPCLPSLSFGTWNFV